MPATRLNDNQVNLLARLPVDKWFALDDILPTRFRSDKFLRTMNQLVRGQVLTYNRESGKYIFYPELLTDGLRETVSSARAKLKRTK